MRRWPSVQLRHVARLSYGDSLSAEDRNAGDVQVFGSNGPTGEHDHANTQGPAIVVGRKGSFGKVRFSDRPVFAIDTTYFIDSSTTQVHMRWLYYALSTLNLDELSQDVGVPGLSREAAYGQRVPLPPADDQRAIADYLDTETARIDALIAKKQRISVVVDDRRRSQVESLLARQTEDGDSWRRMRLRHVCSEITVGVVVEPSSYFSASGIPFIHGTDILEGRIDEGDFKFISPENNELLHKSKVYAGDVLAMRVGEPGRASVVPAHLDGSNCASVLILRCEPALNGALLAAFLNSRRGRSQIEAMQYGAAQGVLNVAHAKEILVDVPPPADQGRISAELEELERYHTRFRVALGHQIELLRERRQALITAAVTGELEVPGVAA